LRRSGVKLPHPTALNDRPHSHGEADERGPRATREMGEEIRSSEAKEVDSESLLVSGELKLLFFHSEINFLFISFRDRLVV